MKVPERIQLADLGNLLDSLKVNPENYINSFVINNLQRFWSEIVGAGLVNSTTPYYYKDHALTIFISHDSYRMELLFIKDMVLKNCNKYTGEYSIKFLKFKIGNIQPVSKVTCKRKTNSENKEYLLAILEKEKDPQANKKLKELIDYL